MYKKFRQLFFRRRHHIIVDEKDVLTALKTISRYPAVPSDWNTFIRNGWVDNKSDRWFIFFTCYDRHWNDLAKELKKIEHLDIVR